MKTNVAIEINDTDRRLLANLIDGKSSARKIKRAEVVELCRQHIAGLVAQATDNPAQIINDHNANPGRMIGDSIYNIDPEDHHILHDKPAGYVRGWNTVKRSAKK